LLLTNFLLYLVAFVAAVEVLYNLRNYRKI
jgi:hypothetical protein